ncbi:type II toxin-antitoxin system VapC family toxin [Ferrovum sp.]|uniref:type II toxin-antitoxin system VapC family toxin n=2 Tax=Ferrovum sp. TaxID=2609467 RepID=UPI002607FCBD|nr:type II toxin-antitoxin system VapC family toxin [Ferrovum sp.]
MTLYMLDTNTVRCLVKKDPTAMQRAKDMPISSLCISALTKGELLFGLAKRPEAIRLHGAVREFLRCVDVMPWDERVAEHYAQIRASLERQGKTLAPLDLLIASHAESIGAVLVTNDQAFRSMGSLRVEDWTEAAT